MYQIELTSTFRRQAKDLPIEVRQILKENLVRLSKDPRDSFLHSKPLHGQFSGCFSFRLTRNYRVIFRHTGDKIIILLYVDDRKDVCR